MGVGDTRDKNKPMNQHPKGQRGEEHLILGSVLPRCDVPTQSSAHFTSFQEQREKGQAFTQETGDLNKT